MKIEELIIDGFKSYAVRTVISNWDDQFNAITGLNGSGKSNILDAICFVLGLTNMSTVRAQNLQDLIYKRGQAGITKASVTIVFNNRDPSTSPIGFEDHPQVSVTRQVIMGGTSKYLINGHRALQQNVQNLFQSVQLNINNPNFLIMQGRITKVLNMKSIEILSMIEEASGTRMFEERKEKAFRTMQRKEAKVDEINTLLREEIEPRLAKLRSEKKTFLEYQHVYNDIERLSQLCIAFDYHNLSLKLEHLEKQVGQKQSSIAETESSILKSREEIKSLEKKIKDLEKLCSSQMSSSSEYASLDSQLQASTERITRLSTSIEIKQSSMQEELQNLRNLKEKRTKADSLREMKEKKFEKSRLLYEQKKQGYEQVLNAVKSQEELISSLSTGLSSSEGHEIGYSKKLHETRDELNQLNAEKEIERMKLQNLSKRISELEPRRLEANKRQQQIDKQVTQLQQDVTKIESRLEKVAHDSTKEKILRQNLDQLRREREQLSDEVDTLQSRLAYLDFRYTDPIPKFDRSKVKGLIAQLFSLNKENYGKQTALEITAGGRLYNVVVENERVGAQLLQNGNLKKRVTMIPLNKISSFVASAERVGAAKKLSNNRAYLALELIGYEEELLPAMQYVFGASLICDDPDVAKKVTFHPNVRLKSVTIDGDVYDPSGILTGGSVNKTAGPLLQLQKLREVSEKLKDKESEYSNLKNELGKVASGNAQFHRLEQELQLKRHELSLMEEQKVNDPLCRLLTEYYESKEELNTLRRKMPNLDQSIQDKENSIKKIEKDMYEWKNNKGSKMTELHDELLKLKEKLLSSTRNVEEAENELNGAKLDRESFNSEQLRFSDNVSLCENSISLLKDELSELELTLNDQQRLRKSLKEKLEQESLRFSGINDELNTFKNKLKGVDSYVNDLQLASQKFKHEHDRLEREKNVADVALRQLDKEHPWIQDRKQNFGQEATMFDFRAQNLRQCKEQLNALKPKFASMRKTINPKVMDMIDGVEKREAKLKAMIRTIHRDKRKIQETVYSIDTFKKKALEKTWIEVNAAFGEIFDELLPGNSAELQPPEGKEFTSGLEIRVRIGSIWKDSLAELSGGQRSLVALALIMSLLKYKPAPMYILDEIDAALDLSHTQNIGRLIKTKFKGSQFIIVSLKEGMFTNANRLFHVRFLDGNSVVQAR
ncbi:condensin complex subunit Cut14 [Schizosaccharomyces cryophilus OY26]|uniref:Structural maintenance of chromosomes protein n=1 Tax=Schizosaccharomyces cryophilus (strain OY26 / ATCC MYA-4695 / CBS 11777 / NBRC 106824 / NRRL Y48691) TaxID=653667 RepID=S9XJF4_SCHCR|nr:condensin complex subunit Cut14 [Schizosaccharomyces cryophilus OY26]EPY53816.1 condensin complex subunit Cut14 [Schizosaccharomyces cryophilus OY26]